LAEVIVVAGGSVVAWAFDLRDEARHLLLPLTATQILWINLVTDGLPALALSLDRNPGVLESPPRDPRAPLLDRPTRLYILASGTVCALLGLGLLGLVPRLGGTLDEARTTLFVYLAAVQLFLAYVARRVEDRPPTNPALHGALLLGLALIALPFGVAPLRRMFGVESPGAAAWLAAAAALVLTVGITALLARGLWRKEEARQRA
jgi:Ca2+-transporting ATPase